MQSSSSHLLVLVAHTAHYNGYFKSWYYSTAHVQYIHVLLYMHTHTVPVCIEQAYKSNRLILVDLYNTFKIFSSRISRKYICL